MNIILIIAIILVVMLLGLQLFNVAVSQKAVNILFCVIFILMLLANSGWLPTMK